VRALHALGLLSMRLPATPEAGRAAPAASKGLGLGRRDAFRQEPKHSRTQK